MARGARFLIAHPRLLIWLIAPALITLLIIAGIIWGVLALADPALAWATSPLPDSLSGWASGVLRLVVVGGLGVAGFLVFVSIAGLLTGPFCESLSEAVEEQVTGREAPGFSMGAFARGLVMGIIHTLRRLGVYLAILVMVFLIGAIIPVVGPAIGFLVGGYFAARSAAYDCFDAVFSRRLWPYRKKLGFLRIHRARTLGVGGATAGLMLVPPLNLFALGLGAAGATLTVIDLEEQARAAPRRPSF